MAVSSPYRPLDRGLLDKLSAIVGPDNAISDPDRLEGYSRDESPLREIARRPEAVVRPGKTADVAAGLPLAGFTAAVEDAGFSFPPHPGDEGAMIGGLISTNAGGSRALKYGGIRNYVRGLEVVLPGGEGTRPGGKVVKSSTG